MAYYFSDLRMQSATVGVLLLMILFLSAGCDTSRSARTAGNNETETKTEEEAAVDKLDTLDRAGEGFALDSLGEKGDAAGIGEEEKLAETELLDNYEVLLLLPFLTNRLDNLQGRFNNISEWSLNFYGGVQMALDELKATELGMHLTVMDSEGSQEKVRYLLANRAMKDSTHLIIGPYRRVNIQEVAKFGKEKEINVVSPYSAASNLTENNPHFIQVRPSLETHCRSLANHALNNYPADKIILVGQDRPLERKSFEYFQEAFFEKVGTRDTNRLEQLLIDPSTGSIADMALNSFMAGRDTAVFLVSAWSSEDESFVYSFLRQLEVTKYPDKSDREEDEAVEEWQEPEITVYGTPVWKDFDRVDLDYFEKMKVHISSHIFLDASATDIRKFRRAYFERYGNLPPEEAFLGYDVMKYFGKMLLENGTQFQYFLEGAEMDGLHTRFEFERVVDPTATAEENPPIKQFENKYVHILQFQDYQFRLVE